MAVRASQQRFSGLGQLDLAAGSVEKLCSQRGFSDWMLLAEGRL
jgi:hypothetical protein